jgi:tRNA dimethylallyltransferase
MPAPDSPAVAILGPTASGKSRLALFLAAKFRGEIVSCDALQIYRGMNIGTAKPTASERNAVRHHMLDLRDPGEDFSAGDYQRQARAELRSICERGSIAFVVGGTGFYLRALIEGLFEGPGRSEELRTRMRGIISRRGAGTLHRALTRVDPEAASRISPTDASRIVRAYEVYLLTGRPMSWWHRQPADPLHGFRWLLLALHWPREVLYERIDRRVEEMIRSGFTVEVEGLMARFPRDCHAFKAIGYRQIADHLDGRCSLAQAVEDIQRESRRYAKRQMTWFRSMQNVRWLDASPGWDDCESDALRMVSEFLA